MKIIEDAFCISNTLLPKVIKSRERNKFFHFAFIYQNNKLISIGQNNPEKTHPKAKKISERFRVELEYNYLHAEMDAISKIWHRYYIDNNMSLIVIRLNRHGKIKNSKPCRYCDKIISCLSFRDVWWSTNTHIVSENNEYELSRPLV